MLKCLVQNLCLRNWRLGRRAWVFTLNCGKSQETILEKKNFKGNTSGSSESETWIEKINYSSIYASQSVELDRLIINVLDLPFFGDFFSVKGIMDTMALVFKLTNYFPILK